MLSSGGVEDFPFLPVGAGYGETVGKQPAVEARVHGHDGGRSIGRQCVRIEQNPRRSAGAVERINDTLVLKAVILEKESTAAFLERNAAFLVVRDFRQAASNCFALRNGFQEPKRSFVLGLNPGLGFSRIEIFKPAVAV